MSTDYGLEHGDAAGPTHVKTPDEIVRVEFQWAGLLDGETISSDTFELPDGLTNAAEDANTNTERWVRVSGGDDNRVYRVINKAVTSGTRTLEQVKRVYVREG